MREVIALGSFKERDCNSRKRYRVLPPLPSPRSGSRSRNVLGDVTRLHAVELQRLYQRPKAVHEEYVYAQSSSRVPVRVVSRPLKCYS
jgi:hypothetical protein